MAKIKPLACQTKNLCLDRREETSLKENPPLWQGIALTQEFRQSDSLTQKDNQSPLALAVCRISDLRI